MGENIKKTFVIDASFILAFLLNEGSKTVDKIIEQFKNNEINLISNSLLKYEIGNSLKTAILRKRIKKTQAIELYQVFLDFNIDENNFDYIEVFKLALSKKITFYDASYLYLSKINHLRLLTLDKALS